MTETEWNAIVKSWNNLTCDIGLEHRQIGTLLSEDTDNWNLCDIIDEADRILDTYFECGHANEMMRHGDAYDRKAWRSEVGKLKRFIHRCLPMCPEMRDGKDCGSVGSYLTLSLWDDWDGEKYPLITAKTVFVDGEKVKADTWYTLDEDGEVVEVV